MISCKNARPSLRSISTRRQGRATAIGGLSEIRVGPRLRRSPPMSPRSALESSPLPTASHAPVEKAASGCRRCVAGHFHSDARFDDDWRHPAHMFLPDSDRGPRPIFSFRGHITRSRRGQAICMMTRSHDRPPRRPRHAADYLSRTVLMSGNQRSGHVFVVATSHVSRWRRHDVGDRPTLLGCSTMSLNTRGSALVRVGFGALATGETAEMDGAPS